MNITREEVQQVLAGLYSGDLFPELQEKAIHLLQSKLAERDEAPINWLEAVTVNLVREGVNKHKARELAQHFHSLIQKDDAEPGEWPKCKACGGNLWMCMACCPSPKQTPTTDVVAMVNQQSEDEGLWFESVTAPEAYLQKALRELHRAVESSKQTPMRDDELTR